MYIIISPIASIPNKYGIAYFASIPLIFSFLSAIVRLFFALTNYPATGYNNMWPLDEYNSPRKYHLQEAIVSTTMQCLLSISKYAFFDIVKELVAMKIHYEIRPLYRGVYDGSITKFGSFSGSIYGIIMFMVTGAEDSRQYFLATSIIVTLICLIWILPIRYLSKSYKTAKESGTYMDPGLEVQSQIK